MTVFDYKSEFDLLLLLVRGAAGLPIDIDGLREHHARAEAIGPLLKPTAYMRGGADNLRDQGEVLDAAIPFIKACRRIVDKHTAIAERHAAPERRP